MYPEIPRLPRSEYKNEIFSFLLSLYISSELTFTNGSCANVRLVSDEPLFFLRKDPGLLTRSRFRKQNSTYCRAALDNGVLHSSLGWDNTSLC